MRVGDLKGIFSIGRMVIFSIESFMIEKGDNLVSDTPRHLTQQSLRIATAYSCCEDRAVCSLVRQWASAFATSHGTNLVTPQQQSLGK